MDTLTRKATGVRITWIVVAVVVGLGLAPQLTPAKIVVESSVDTLAAFGTVIHEAQRHAGLTESEIAAISDSLGKVTYGWLENCHQEGNEDDDCGEDDGCGNGTGNNGGGGGGNNGGNGSGTCTTTTEIEWIESWRSCSGNGEDGGGECNWEDGVCTVPGLNVCLESYLVPCVRAGDDMQPGTSLATAAAVLLVFPAAGQETRTDTLYRGADIPVWVMVSDAAETGVYRVLVTVAWDDYRSGLPFAGEIGAADLTVLLPKSESPDEATLANACRFRSAQMEHGSAHFQITERAEADCFAPPTERLVMIGIQYVGAPVPMVCNDATREDGTEDPAVRYFACYWAVSPT